MLIGTLIKRMPTGCITPSRIVGNNKIYTDNSDICEQFNQYFINVGPQLASTIPQNNENPMEYIKKTPLFSFVMSPVTDAQVSRLFSNLDEQKASLDIPSKLIKIAAKPLSKPLAFIYNQSITTGIVRDASQVTPIYKSGDVTDTGNYRPIATLSSFRKVLEPLIYDQLYAFLEKYDVIYKYQFGFRKGFSTEQAILEITDSLDTAIDNKQITCGIFLDFSKAFDTVNHNILLSKLYAYGIRGIPYNWFESYLHQHTQCIKIGDTRSSLDTIICGIPQGSTLGPLLFLFYINDLPNSSSKFSFRIFADDTNMFFSSNSSSELESFVNNELEQVLRI